MNAKCKYLAITGDLRHSRQAEDRAELQRNLIRAIDSLNEYHGIRSGFAAPLAMTAGDAVQCLVRHPEVAVEVIHRLSEAARPSEFTFGFGFGPISTDLNENVALIDGPAFHMAREALEQARSDDAWAAARGSEGADAPITAIMYLMGAVRRRWTDRQVEFIRQMEKSQKQTVIAETLNVSQSVVSESLKAAAAYQYRFASEALRGMLKDSVPNS